MCVWGRGEGGEGEGRGGEGEGRERGGDGKGREGKGEGGKGGQILQLHVYGGTHTHTYTHTHTHTHTYQARAWLQELPPPVSHVTAAPRHGQNMEGGNNCELSGGHGCPDWRERRRGKNKVINARVHTLQCTMTNINMYMHSTVTMTTVHHSLSPEQLSQYVMQKDVSLWAHTTVLITDKYSANQ